MITMQEVLTSENYPYRVNEWVFGVWNWTPSHLKANAAASQLTWEMTIEHFRRMAELEVKATGVGYFDVVTVETPQGDEIQVAYVLDSANRLWYVAELSK